MNTNSLSLSQRNPLSMCSEVSELGFQTKDPGSRARNPGSPARIQESGPGIQLSEPTGLASESRGLARKSRSMARNPEIMDWKSRLMDSKPRVQTGQAHGSGNWLQMLTDFTFYEYENEYILDKVSIYSAKSRNPFFMHDPI